MHTLILLLLHRMASQLELSMLLLMQQFCIDYAVMFWHKNLFCTAALGSLKCFSIFEVHMNDCRPWTF